METRMEKIELARRALAHFDTKGTDQAASTLELPVTLYGDVERFQREKQAIFMELPLALAMSIELPEPGSYKAMTVMDKPVLLSRDENGQVHAFINACRHRGAPVCQEGKGQGKRFVCPYHAWQYGLDGQLKGIYGSNTFGDVSPATHSLTELPCAEQSGLIWVCLTPGKVFDIDEWLQDFKEQLDGLQLNNWHIYEQRWLDGPGWKVAWDGYLEAYHHNTLHANTVGRYTIGNLMLHDTYGPHQRLVFARRTLAEMKAQEEKDWDPDLHLRQIHSVFPNLSISGVLGDHCLVSHVFPGATPETTRTLQTVLVAKVPETEEEKNKSEAFSATVLQAVQQEDYPMGYKIQQGLPAGGNRFFTIGRNEPAIQHYHKWVRHFAGDEEQTCL
ncbi:aromatic ring-hydroxylating dioxygenase subunit alpha [Advenella alkanexedens]|uniref:Aromatic ring-hydroxylating dioxygenase subunit alpha n=1 Tax=Advenella alkanexedens TaxID=1481665 RepID=A0ABS6NLH2_9BURK|nr:aromatic ring-hydroxylating dioxygenase subunit alpha [Advenella alkanexedens]MBV4396479.1 aromatic ring-hydroxylating dioxygenase subunit alpha [Advenella alkanexedens]